MLGIRTMVSIAVFDTVDIGSSPICPVAVRIMVITSGSDPENLVSITRPPVLDR